MQGGEVDAHGNRQLSGSGAGRLPLHPRQGKTRRRPRPPTPTSPPANSASAPTPSATSSAASPPSSPNPTPARPASAAASPSQYALAEGGGADGLASGSVAMKRVGPNGTANAPYQIDFFPTPLATVARQTKHLPVDWVANGNTLTDAYLHYARPLAGPMPRPGRLI